MILKIRKNQIVPHGSILDPYIQKALLKVSGYKIKKLELEIPHTDVTIADFQAFVDIAAGYSGFPIWFEIENQYANNNIPASLSFSTYQDEDGNPIQRKISDMTIGATTRDTLKSIYYLDGITSKITKSDLNILVANPLTNVLSSSEYQEKINDPGGEYYVEPEI